LINDLGIISLALGILVPNVLRIIMFSITVIILWSRYIQFNFFNIGNIDIFLLFKDVKFLYLRRLSSITSENIETAVAGIFFTTEIAAFISIIKRLFISIQMFSTGIAISTYTSLSHVFAENNQDKLKNAVGRTIYSFQLVHLFGSSLILASVGPLIFVWLGENLIFDFSFIFLVSVNIFLLAQVNVFNSILYTAGDYSSVAYISILEALLRIALTYLFIASFSFYGLPLAGILASVIALIYLIKLIRLQTGHTALDLIYPGSLYELSIYTLACIIGFYHEAGDGRLYEAVSILLVTLVLSFALLFSRKARELGNTIYKALR
jgi:O-antigen/teichoic acid export membrane protein